MPKFCSCAAVWLIAASSRSAAVDPFLVQRVASQPDGNVELKAALLSVLGCGADKGTAPAEYADVPKAELAPMWEQLPKNRWGHVEVGVLRYAIHRYFMQRSNMALKLEVLLESMDGIEPVVMTALLNGTSQGFSLDDAALLVAAADKAILDRESRRLFLAYRSFGIRPRQRVPIAAIFQIVETYVKVWMLGQDDRFLTMHAKNARAILDIHPSWPRIQQFVLGTVKKMQFEVSRHPKFGAGMSAMQRYSFEDAQRAIRYIQRDFATSQYDECQELKAHLVAMDRRGTGRVMLSDFYGSGIENFVESEAYLREIGALDETSVLGQQVILLNYLQGPSNCVAYTPVSSVCCSNECEGVLREVEVAVGAPVASADEVLEVVQGMWDLDDALPVLGDELAARLHQVANAWGGKVPLHGRLFAQWLHFAFPQECPYPNLAGAASFATPKEFRGQAFATSKEVASHRRRHESSMAHDEEEAPVPHRLSQWCEEEALLSEYGSFDGPTEITEGPWLGCGLGAFALIAVAGTAMSSLAGDSPSGPKRRKHFV